MWPYRHHGFRCTGPCPPIGTDGPDAPPAGPAAKRLAVFPRRGALGGALSAPATPVAARRGRAVGRPRSALAPVAHSVLAVAASHVLALEGAVRGQIVGAPTGHDAPVALTGRQADPRVVAALLLGSRAPRGVLGGRSALRRRIVADGRPAFRGRLAADGH